MKKLTVSQMIDFLEGKTSKNQSKKIRDYIEFYPYYSDILKGLYLELQEQGSKDAVLHHIHQQKEKTCQNLSSKTTPKTTVL